MSKVKLIAKTLLSENILVQDENNLPKNMTMAQFFHKLKIFASILTVVVVIPSLIIDSNIFDMLSNVLIGMFYFFAIIATYFNYEDSKEHIKSLIFKNMLPVLALMVLLGYSEKFFKF